MRSSILCVRDYLSIFYIVFFLFSSVLNNLFSGRLICLHNTESSKHFYISKNREEKVPKFSPKYLYKLKECKNKNHIFIDNREMPFYNKNSYGRDEL